MNNLRKTRNQAGFSFVEVLLVLVIVGAIVAIGFYVTNLQNKTEETNTTQESEAINDAQDLRDAEEELNQQDLDALDDSELQEAEEDLL